MRSAIANAEQKAQAENITVDVDELWVKECFVDKGVTTESAPRTAGADGTRLSRAAHYSHITITVSSEREAKPTKTVTKKTGERPGSGDETSAPA